MKLFDRVKTAADLILGREEKAAMTFSRFGGIGGFNYLDENFRVNFNYPFNRNTLIDYRQEVGDLTQSSLVMSAVGWTGRALPQAVFRVYDLRGDKPQPLPKHPLYNRLRRPNPYFSGSTVWKATALSWILSGNAYWLKARSGAGRVRELWWLPHWLVTPRRDTPEDFVSYYEYRVDGVPFRLEPEDVVHFRDGVDPSDDMRGISPVRSLLREIFTDNEYSQYSALLAKNAGVPPFGVVPKTAPGTRVDYRGIKEELVRRTSGDERGKPAVFTSDVEIVKFGFSPEEMDLAMLRRVPEERLAGVIGIPSIVLGFGSGLERGTFSNFEQAVEMAYEGFLVPLWDYFADEMTAQVLPDYDGQPRGDELSREVRADTTKVRALQEDQNELFTRLDSSFQSGWLKRSEARAMAGLEVDEGEDDVYYFDVVGGSSMGEGEEGEEEEQDQERGDDEKRARAFRFIPWEYRQKQAHDYSNVAVLLPPAIAQSMLAFGSKIPDERLATDGRENEPHVTVRFGLHTQDAEEVRRVLQDEPPVMLSFGVTGLFQSPEMDVLFIEVISPDLERLNATLGAVLANTQTQPQYVPHATIAYLKPGEGKQYMDNSVLLGARFTADRVVFSTCDNRKTEIALSGERRVKSFKGIVGEVDTGSDQQAREWWAEGISDEFLQMVDAERVR